MINISDVTKKFTTGRLRPVVALNNVSFEINDGDFVSIVGPSGSGKTTLLNIIAGLQAPTSGSAALGGSMQRIGYVFQSDSIFPWRTVRRNISFPLEMEGLPPEQIDTHVVTVCRDVGLDPELFLEKYPRDLSGGERRRVAIGVAIARKAELLLLDEPTSQLDYLSKWNIQELIQKIWLGTKIAVLVVTHDIEEAIFLSDRVFVLEKGVLKDSVDIDLPRPRSNVSRDQSDFIDLKRRIAAAFRYEE